MANFFKSINLFSGRHIVVFYIQNIHYTSKATKDEKLL